MDILYILQDQMIIHKPMCHAHGLTQASLSFVFDHECLLYVARSNNYLQTCVCVCHAHGLIQASETNLILKLYY